VHKLPKRIGAPTLPSPPMNPLFLFGILGGVGALAYTIVKHELGRQPPRSPDRALDLTPRPSPRPPMDENQSTGIRRDHEAIVDDANGEIGPIIPTMGDWARILAPMCLDANIPLPFALAWIDTESGGNPCAIGDPTAHGWCGDRQCTDPRYGAFPREMGVAQIYNAHDFKELGINPSEFRAYCGPSQGGQFSQVVARPLTQDEIKQQAKAAIGKIKMDSVTATHQLMNINAGPAWAPDRQDFWRLVKLQHGLPGLASSGLPTVSRKLGRAPINWSEFRKTVAAVHLDRGTERYRNQFNRILDNAEKTASSVVEKGVA
jgi:hypothetical protein